MFESEKELKLANEFQELLEKYQRNEKLSLSECFGVIEQHKFFIMNVGLMQHYKSKHEKKKKQ